MRMLFLRLVTGCGIFLISSLVLAISDNTRDTITGPQKITNDKVTVECGKADSLVFCGVQNETKNGEISFKLLTKSNHKKFLVMVTGSTFENGNLSLDTEYQPEDAKSWYKSGDAFPVLALPGDTNIIKYKVTSGPRISSQQAGVYTARLSFVVTPYLK